MPGMTRTWWGEIFLQVLEESMDEGRLKRGRPYSRPNRLLSFTINGTVASATVRGNVNPYFGVYTEPRYKVTVRLKKFNAAEWDRIAEAISRNAAFLSQLLMNEMPDRIDDVLHKSRKGLLPNRRDDLISKCSCPDWADPCKHVAGVYYKIAQLLDDDPMLLFQLRGMDFVKFRRKLEKSPLGQALLDQFDEVDQTIEYSSHRYTQPTKAPSPEVGIDSFWKTDKPVPPVDPDAGKSVTPAVLVKRGGDYPAFWHMSHSFIEVMETVSTRIVDKNKSSL